MTARKPILHSRLEFKHPRPCGFVVSLGFPLKQLEAGTLRKFSTRCQT